MNLNSEQIDFIVKDLHRRGLLVDGLKDEIIDHACTAVETDMQNGARFVDAYKKVLLTFGGSAGLVETQKKTIESRNINLTIMLQNYFVVAFRNLHKQRFYTLINITGLAVGVASCLIILLYVVNELSYDRHYANHERIYRVNADLIFGENNLTLALAPAPMADVLQKNYPEVEASARLWENGPVLFRRTEESIRENNVIFADSTFFKIFDVPFLSGDPNTALIEPSTMAISKKAADKYFPGENALGQTLTSNSGRVWKITGIYEDMPVNSHFHFDFMLSLVSNDYNKDQNWLSNNFVTYIKLREGASAKELEAKFPKMVETYAGPQLSMALGKDVTIQQFFSQGNKYEFTLLPVTAIHLHSARIGELSPSSDITYVYLFGTIAAFVLLIACINFMNLSTARSANRAKEVGVRKVMGSMRSHLVRQFLMESVLLSAFSFAIAIGLSYAVLPVFNEMSLKELSLPFSSFWFWTLLCGAALITGVMAGLYPSFFLSAFKPVNVLKGNVAMGTKSGVIRGALVVFQFSISIILIVGTIAVNRQIAYIQNKKIGFEKDQVIVVNDTYALRTQLQAFKDEVLKDSRIKNGTISGFLPVDGSNRSDQTIWPEGVTPNDENLVSTQLWNVDVDYIKTLGMKLKAGRDFSEQFPSDSNAVILNESALRMLGYTEANAIGRKIETFGGGALDPSQYVRYEIIGVVENFHFESLRNNIKPLGLLLGKSTAKVSFAFEAKDTKDIINAIETSWKKFGPGLPFDYTFLDQAFGRMYAAETRLGRIFSLFAVLAIIIACLGLFALTAFTAEQRTKEIGIRKVLGASVSGIVVLLSKEFGKLILIAFVIAAPAAWYGISLWLESYQYKTEIGIAVYVLAGVASFAVAWITMSFQSIKAALANPVKSLRSE